MNKDELYELIKETNICQISAMKNGKIVYTETWNNYKQDDSVHIASVTKSITSILVGIAIDKGYIKNVNQKVLEFFPEYIVKKGEKTIKEVTINHLLTMTAPYKYKSEPWTKVCSSDDWTKTVLDLLGGKTGITGEFKYSTLGIQILNGIITKTSNMNALELANKYLFEPLDIEPRIGYNIKNKEEHIRFITEKEPKKKIWLCDSNKIPASGFGLCLSANDLLKIGSLFLNNGLYNNKKIISQKWLEQITTPCIKCGEKYGFMQYGKLWWIIDDKKQIYSAIGDSGNIIYINKNENIIITVTATFKPRILDRVQFIQKYIEPYIRSIKM